MKYTAKDIARALADMVVETGHGDHTATHVDNALSMLRLNNAGRSVRSFPTLVERALRRANKEVDAHLITPTGDAGPVGAQIEKALRDSLQKDIHLEQVADPDMIGGAVLVIGDELYDISIPGALEHLREYLKHSSFGQQSDSPQS